MLKTHLILVAATVALAACGTDSSSSAGPKSAEAAQPAASRANEQDLQWGPAPPVFPAGAQMALLQGDPSKAELFTVRLRFPNGYKIAPHTHPTAENVTVLSGTFLAGMGTEFKVADLKTFGKDAFASIPANHPHYAMARGLTIVQVHAIGPFQLTYVNPADNPVANR